MPASWLAYPTLTHGDAAMVKFAGVHLYKQQIAAALRRHGPLVLAELRVETTGPWAGQAVRVIVDGVVLGSVQAALAAEYNTVVQELNAAGVRATIHAELEVSGTWVDMWGLCRPTPRRPGEPLFPTQYRRDVALLPGMAEDLDAGLNSRAKTKKVRRDGRVAAAAGGGWQVIDCGRVIGHLEPGSDGRLRELQRAGLPLDVVITLHRTPGKGLTVHVSIPPDA